MHLAWPGSSQVVTGIGENLRVYMLKRFSIQLVVRAYNPSKGKDCLELTVSLGYKMCSRLAYRGRPCFCLFICLKCFVVVFKDEGDNDGGR